MIKSFYFIALTLIFLNSSGSETDAIITKTLYSGIVQYTKRSYRECIRVSRIKVSKQQNHYMIHPWRPWHNPEEIFNKLEKEYNNKSHETN